MADYQYYLLRARLEKPNDEYNGEVQSVRGKLADPEERSDTILQEFQGTVSQAPSFFGGLIALIVIFVQVGLPLPLARAARLITILIGGVVLAFGSLSVVLPARIPAKRIAVVYATGFSLMGGAGPSILLP